MSRRAILWWLLLLTLTLAACEDAEGPSGADEAGPAAGITATAAYREFFGAPPTVREGTCFAMVGFLADRDLAGRIRPIPLFTFDHERRREDLVRKLLGFDAGVANALGLKVPFPPGTRLERITLQGTLAVLTLDGPPAADARQVEAMTAILAQALGQFDGIERVRLDRGGQDQPGQPEPGAAPDPDAILGPGPPRLIALRRDEHPVDGRIQVAALFDRPVEVRGIEFATESGPLAGDWYTGVFDMAAILEADAAMVPAIGRSLMVRWEVTDPLGRAARGETSMLLEPAEHP